MKRTLVRTLPLIVLAFSISAQSSAATAKKGKVKPAASAPAKPKVEDSELTLGEKILPAILAKISAPPRIQARVNFGNDGAMNELKANTQIPFSGNIVIPLGKPQGNNPQVDKLIPIAELRTAGRSLKWTANTDPKGNTLSNDITFVNAAGQPDPLIVAVGSTLTDLIELRIESMTVAVDGLKKSSAVINIVASCDLEQSLIDLNTGKMQWQDTICEFKGKYVRDAKDGQKFTFRFLYDSF